MSEGGVQRRLATIVAMDVVGYSALSERDEAAAVATVAALKRVAEAAATRHGGRIFNTAGDAVMMEFPAASAGLKAALDILTETRAGVSDLPQIRVGVHLGEVSVAPSGDILGHGVNVAARLEQMAAPGTVLVSGVVRDQIREAAAVAFVPRGRVQLSKMAETLAVFAAHPPGDAPDLAARAGRGWLTAALGATLAVAIVLAAGFAVFWMGRAAAPRPTEPLVAVLPFDNLSADPDLAFFSDGVSEQIQIALRGVKGLRVAGRASSFSFRGGDKSLSRIRELIGATHVLDGSVRREGDRVRISVELTDTRDSTSLWAQTYNRDIADTLRVQDEIASRVASVLRVVVPSTADVATRIDPKALDIYLRMGETPVGPVSIKEMAAAAARLRQVVKLAPDFAPAWADLAFMDSYRVESDVAHRAEIAREGRNAAEKAIALDPSLGPAYAGLARLIFDGTNWAEQENVFLRGLEAAPNDPDLLSAYGEMFLVQTGRLNEAVNIAAKARALDPLARSIIYDYRQALILVGRLDEVESELREEVPHYDLFDPWYGVILSRLARGEVARARDGVTELRRQIEALRTNAPEGTNTPTDFYAVAASTLEQFDSLVGLVEKKNPETVDLAVAAALEEAKKGQGNALYSALPLLATLGRQTELLGMIRTLYIEGGFVPAEPLPDSVFAEFPNRRPPPDMLFSVLAETLRRDPAFFEVFFATGHVKYWSETGRWPDFCADPALPYRCAEESARLLATH